MSDLGQSGDSDPGYSEWQFQDLVDEADRLRTAAINLVAALDHWSAEGGGPEPGDMKINSATGRHATRVALAGLRKALSATTAI
jgi:hypothetical protein